MSRINIDDKLFGDDRFIEFASLVGNYQQAIGASVQIFRLGQRYWCNDSLIPLSQFKKIKNSDLFIQSGLASRKKGGVYVCGSHEHFDWIRQKRDAGRKGAESRWKKHGGPMADDSEKWPPAPAPAPAISNENSVDESITPHFNPKGRQRTLNKLEEIKNRSKQELDNLIKKIGKSDGR